MSSKKLKKVLEVVLAFGNVMNRGSRGNAYGFKLSSLNRVADTKSNADRDMTLLHYVVKTLENKVSECDMPAIAVGIRIMFVIETASIYSIEIIKGQTVNHVRILPVGIHIEGPPAMPSESACSAH